MTRNKTISPGDFLLKLRGLAFWLIFAPLTLLCAVLLLATFFLPHAWHCKLLTLWARIILWWLAVTCRLRHEIEGTEYLSTDACIVFSKHQSTWETIALQLYFPKQVWVAKRELLWIPFFGWGLALMKAIAIKRGSGRAAVRQLVSQGRQRLDEGMSVIIFPEGTRTAPGQRSLYRIGGAILAEKTGYPVIPVAHNAGEYWARRSFIKHPGTIRMVIGPAINPAGKTAQEILDEGSGWIEARMDEITTLQN